MTVTITTKAKEHSRKGRRCRHVTKEKKKKLEMKTGKKNLQCGRRRQKWWKREYKLLNGYMQNKFCRQSQRTRKKGNVKRSLRIYDRKTPIVFFILIIIIIIIALLDTELISFCILRDNADVLYSSKRCHHLMMKSLATAKTNWLKNNNNKSL